MILLKVMVTKALQLVLSCFSNTFHLSPTLNSCFFLSSDRGLPLPRGNFRLEGDHRGHEDHVVSPWRSNCSFGGERSGRGGRRRAAGGRRGRGGGCERQRWGLRRRDQCSSRQNEIELFCSHKSLINQSIELRVTREFHPIGACVISNVSLSLFLHAVTKATLWSFDSDLQANSLKKKHKAFFRFKDSRSVSLFCVLLYLMTRPLFPCLGKLPPVMPVSP